MIVPAPDPERGRCLPASRTPRRRPDRAAGWSRRVAGSGPRHPCVVALPRFRAVACGNGRRTRGPVGVLHARGWCCPPALHCCSLCWAAAGGWQRPRPRRWWPYSCSGWFPLDYGRAAADAAARRRPRARHVELRTMSLNAKLGEADAAEIVRLVRENGIDPAHGSGIHPGHSRTGWLPRDWPHCSRTGSAHPRTAPPGTPSTPSTNWQAAGRVTRHAISRCR